jgi:hypothetical protein
MTGPFPMNLRSQVKILRQIVRLTLPGFEETAGSYMPEQCREMRERARGIRKFLRDTTPRKKK